MMKVFVSVTGRIVLVEINISREADSQCVL